MHAGLKRWRQRWLAVDLGVGEVRTIPVPRTTAEAVERHGMELLHEGHADASKFLALALLWRGAK